MIYQFNQFTLDSERYQLKFVGEPVAIKPLVFNLLGYLIENRDRVVTRIELLDNLWQGKVVCDSALAARLRDARKVIHDSGTRQEVITMALLRLIRSEGRIVFDGNEMHGLKANALKTYRRSMQIVFQDPYGSLSPRRSVRQIIEQGLRVHEPHLDDAELTARVDDALQDVGLDPADKDRYPHEFSGGERQRIAIARAIVLRPKFVVLDEPTSALDMSVQAQVIDLLRDLQQRYELSYLFISHDLKVVRALADDLIVMKDGIIVEQGKAADIFERPAREYTREFEIRRRDHC